MMTADPMTVPCPTCAARPGSPCMARVAEVGFSLAREPHRRRVEDALGLTSPEAIPMTPDETRWRHLSLMGDVHPPQPDLTREYIQPGTGRREAPCLCPDCQGRQAVVFR